MTELDPELKKYIRGALIVHPLFVLPVPNSPEEIEQLNLILKRRITAAEAAKAKKDWYEFLQLHQRIFRHQVFLGFWHELNPDDYWKIISWVWCDADSTTKNTEVWRQLFSNHMDHRREMMWTEEIEAFDNLPQSITVYRGCAVGGEAGLSWSTDREVAINFATKFMDVGSPDVLLITGEVRKADVIAYLLRREESEILCLPENVENQKVEKLQGLQP